MGYSLLSLGQHTKNNALRGLSDVAAREERQESANKQLKAAERQQTVSSVTSGAALGMMAGMQSGAVGGPMGMAIGAAAGLVLGELF